MMLQKIGARAVVLHSILKQKQRFSALERFKSHKARILVATGLLSRLKLKIQNLYFHGAVFFN